MENKTDFEHLPDDCELILIRDSIPRLGIVELDKGTRLPGMAQRSSFQNLQEKRTLHLTHAVTETMVLQTKNRLFWPRMRQDLENHNSQCKPCTEIKISLAQKPNEVNMGNLFENFFPKSRVQIDYAEKGNGSSLVL